MSNYRIEDRKNSMVTSPIADKVDKDDFPFELSQYNGSQFRTVALIRTKMDARKIMHSLLVSDFQHTYRQQIHDFFQGTLLNSIYSKELGKIRIVNHDNMETLQVEPIEGGQYEIAVRIPIPKSHTENMGYHNEYGDKYHGYIASDGYMWGRNTGGH
jgi:hypothetical protein